ncbi:MAG: fibronectin type III domain-containing protein, partial [Methanobacteriota archaeon]
TPPGAPQGLVATAGDATVTLTWSAPSSNGGSPITNYRIYRGTSSNGETLKATIGNVLTYADTTVTNGVTYYYQVSAVNNVGEGPRSNEASATPTAPATPPGAPQGLGATAGDATVTLAWSAPSSNGGSPITNYRIYRGTASGGETLKATIGNVLTYSDTSVTNGVTYYYQVSAVNAAGEGPRSNEASATPSPPPPPPDFSISATPASLSIQIGSSGTSTIALTSLNGFAGTIGLSTSIACSGLCLVYPTASLNPTSVTLTSGSTGVSTLTVATSVLTTPGTYTITITATSGSITHTVTVTVTVHL